MATKEKEVSKPKQEIEVSRPTRVMSPFEEMDRIFENVFPRGWLRPFRELPSWSEMAAPLEERMPKVNVIDRDEEVFVRAELPGVKKENLEVSVSENAVTIKGETKREEKEEKGDYYRCEISQGAFARTISLPHYINTENTKATFKDGILELTLPKVEKTKRRTVQIE